MILSLDLLSKGQSVVKKEDRVYKHIALILILKSAETGFTKTSVKFPGGHFLWVFKGGVCTGHCSDLQTVA